LKPLNLLENTEILPWGSGQLMVFSLGLSYDYVANDEMMK
jgi:hypothetical protein